jgi:hypothetical protein
MLALLPAAGARPLARFQPRRCKARRSAAPRASLLIDDNASALPKETSPFDALASAAPSWGALMSAQATAVARSVGQFDDANVALKAACLAASRLNAETAYEVMDTSMDVVTTFTGAYDGELSSCALICDAHVRLLAHRLLTADVAATRGAYAALAALPPVLRRQHTAGTAATGAAALLALREEAELLRTMLAFVEDGTAPEAEEEARAEAGAAAALCAAVDDVIAAMPQPEAEETA